RGVSSMRRRKARYSRKPDVHFPSLCRSFCNQATSTKHLVVGMRRDDNHSLALAVPQEVALHSVSLLNALLRRRAECPETRSRHASPGSPWLNACGGELEFLLRNFGAHAIR